MAATDFTVRPTVNGVNVVISTDAVVIDEGNVFLLAQVFS